MTQNTLRYSRQNPPSSAEDAKVKLDELDEAIAGIRGQLEFFDPESYESDDQYIRWQSGVLFALSMMVAEHTFLGAWLRDPEVAASIQEYLNARLGAGATTSLRAMRIARALADSYSPMLGVDRQPADLVEA